MTPNHDDSVSRTLIRAVLESRDRRHNETHAVLVGMFQCLVSELVEQGALSADPLADRLTRMAPSIAPGPNGAAGAHMLDHVVTWLRSIQPALPPPHPTPWSAPPLVQDAPAPGEGGPAPSPA